MNHRWLRWLALGTGLILLVTVLIALQVLVLREHAEGQAAIDARHDLAVELAREVIANQLAGAANAAEQRAELARQDPLVDDSGLALIDHGHLLLPRVRAFKAGSGTPTDDLVNALLRAASNSESDLDFADEPDSPAAERLQRYLDLARATREGDADAITLAYRQLLVHRANYRLEQTRALALRVAAVEWMAKLPSTSSELMQLELRDGIAFAGGSPMPGLQRSLLEMPALLTATDFARFVSRITRLSEQFLVKSDDFTAQSSRRDDETIRWPEQAWSGDPSTVLIDTASGWASRADPSGQQRLAFRVDLSQLTASALQRVAPLGVQRIDLPAHRQHRDAASLSVILSSDAWRSERERLDARLWYKSALVVVCLVMALALIAMLLWVQRRRARLLDMQAEFVATVSHELKTPLTSMRLQAESLLRRLPNDGPLQRYPQRIIRDADGLSGLVENILSYNRLHRARWRRRDHPCHLLGLLEQAAETVHAESGQALDIDLSAVSDRSLRGDPELLRIAFANLLRNAIVYNQSDQPRVWITVQEDKRLIMQFHDNGIGIDPTQWQRLIQPFERGGGGRGSGLGLALCRRIARLHGGDVAIIASSSEPPGTGSVIQMSLAI